MMNYTTTAGVQGICPDRWHLPTDEEWTTLTNYVSSQTAYLCLNTSTYIAKSLASKTNWTSAIWMDGCSVGRILATNNATGFTGLPGGYRSNGGSLYDINDYCNWWTSTASISEYHSYYRAMGHLSPTVSRATTSKNEGHSVRCLKD
jgi:uncharacterized protein (TIGR02145 family)